MLSILESFTGFLLIYNPCEQSLNGKQKLYFITAVTKYDSYNFRIIFYIFYNKIKLTTKLL